MTGLRKLLTATGFCIIIAFSFLLCTHLAAEARIKFREVDSVSKAQYLPRKGIAWKAQGRLVGTTLNAPDSFTLIFTNKLKNTSVESKQNGHLSIYESVWIIPGKYDLQIKAEGFETHIIRDVEIKAGHDCLMNIVFGKKVYDRAA